MKRRDFLKLSAAAALTRPPGPSHAPPCSRASPTPAGLPPAAPA